jgi:hypothetical protein
MTQLLTIQSSRSLAGIVICIVLTIHQSSPRVLNLVISVVLTIHPSSSHLTGILISIVMSLTKGCGKKMWSRENCP